MFWFNAYHATIWLWRIANDFPCPWSVYLQTISTKYDFMLSVICCWKWWWDSLDWARNTLLYFLGFVYIHIYIHVLWIWVDGKICVYRIYSLLFSIWLMQFEWLSACKMEWNECSEVKLMQNFNWNVKYKTPPQPPKKKKKKEKKRIMLVQCCGSVWE